MWTPPSETLERVDGIWRPGSDTPVSYPEKGNQNCFLVEEKSYWFQHRNRCLLAVLDRYHSGGEFYDIGGGNGFVAKAVQDSGRETVLVEPGAGALNAKSRGIRNIIQGTLEDTRFRGGSLQAAGAFDVLEHIEDDLEFLRHVANLLKPDGLFYCTVPALSALWSEEDEYAGHFRRYSRTSLSRTMREAGMEVLYLTYLFSWLAAPIFLLRALPHRVRRLRGLPLDSSRHESGEKINRDHSLPAAVAPFARSVHRWELARVGAGGMVPTGSSLLCVCRPTG